MKIKVNVTARDIRLGCQRNTSNCPIARAIGRHFPTKAFDKVIVGAIYVRFYQYRNAISLHLSRLPVAATSFIKNFDNGKPVKPFVFELDIPNA